MVVIFHHLSIQRSYERVAHGLILVESCFSFGIELIYFAWLDYLKRLLFKNQALSSHTRLINFETNLAIPIIIYFSSQKLDDGYDFDLDDFSDDEMDFNTSATDAMYQRSVRAAKIGGFCKPKCIPGGMYSLAPVSQGEPGEF